MLDRSRSRDRSKTGGAFSPAGLFVTGAQGAWYDPSDYSTLFQNATGTTPVTAVEQPVRLMLDRSRGLVLGSELVTNGGFDSATGWTVPAGWAISGGQAVATATGGSLFGGSMTTVSGRWYQVEFDVVSYTSGNLLITIGANYSGNPTLTGAAMAPGRKSVLVLGGASTTRGVEFYGGSITATIDNISVRELPGNHATAPNDASRPVLRARYNLLTFSEQFDNAAWLKQSGGTGSAPVVTANAAVAPDGTMTADQVAFALNGGTSGSDLSVLNQQISSTITLAGSFWVRASSNVRIAARASTTWRAIDVTTGWQRVVLPSDTGAGLQIGLRGGVVSGLPDAATVEIWGAQLLTAADQSATGGAYQRIAAATVYDTSNPVWRPYLAFDGSDDSFSTSAIDFSGTDEVTVFVGVHKASDAAQAVVAEFTAASGGGASFAIWAPGSTVNGYQFRSMGTTDSNINVTTYTSPITNVLTLQGDISAPLLRARINAVQVANIITTQGTGNYANAALFIGRRNNTSQPFNGRLTSLIVLGRTATAAEISATEQWVAGKTGVTLP